MYLVLTSVGWINLEQYRWFEPLLRDEGLNLYASSDNIEEPCLYLGAEDAARVREHLTHIAAVQQDRMEENRAEYRRRQGR